MSIYGTSGLYVNSYLYINIQYKKIRYKLLFLCIFTVMLSLSYSYIIVHFSLCIGRYLVFIVLLEL